MVNMFTFWFTGCCIYVLCATQISGSQPDLQLTDSQTDAEPSGMLLSDTAYEVDMEKSVLKKRAITQAAKGLAAAEKLLKGATKVATQSKSYRLYKKNGHYETALQDFYSVEPRLLNNPRCKHLNNAFGRSAWNREARRNFTILFYYISLESLVSCYCTYMKETVFQKCLYI